MFPLIVFMKLLSFLIGKELVATILSSSMLLSSSWSEFSYPLRIDFGFFCSCFLSFDSLNLVIVEDIMDVFVVVGGLLGMTIFYPHVIRFLFLLCSYFGVN